MKPNEIKGPNAFTFFSREGTPTPEKKVNALGPLISLAFVRFFPLEKALGAVRQRLD